MKLEPHLQIRKHLGDRINLTSDLHLPLPAIHTRHYPPSLQI